MLLLLGYLYIIIYLISIVIFILKNKINNLIHPNVIISCIDRKHNTWHHELYRYESDWHKYIFNNFIDKKKIISTILRIENRRNIEIIILFITLIQHVMYMLYFVNVAEDIMTNEIINILIFFLSIVITML